MHLDRGSTGDTTMNDFKSNGWTVAASIVVFALSACGQAGAVSRTRDQRPAAPAQVAVISDSAKAADADADDGPGCAEGSLAGGASRAEKAKRQHVAAK
jgi:hypothetical protein